MFHSLEPLALVHKTISFDKSAHTLRFVFIEMAFEAATILEMEDAFTLPDVELIVPFSLVDRAILITYFHQSDLGVQWMLRLAVVWVAGIELKGSHFLCDSFHE